ncbi:MAG: hypothetical protein ACRDJC_13100 [Thermomicrobiales bacterium]
MTDVEARVRELCQAPAGCAFLLAVAESAITPEEAAEPVTATYLAALAVEEVSPWFPAHDRVVAMALEHGPRLFDLAREILRQPAAASWFGPIGRRAQQWTTTLDRTDSVPRPRRPDRPITNWERYAQKPDWGLWTSTELDDAAATTSFLACVAYGAGDIAADFDLPFARYRLTIAPTARVYEIDGPGAWHRLCTRYPTSGEDDRLVPDWPAIAVDWDGVHLTLGGLLTAEQVRVEGPQGWTEHWAWDAEQTVWLRDVFDAVRLPDLTELAEPPDWIAPPRALWINPSPDTWPWLVSIPMGPEADEPNHDNLDEYFFPPTLRR